MNLEATSSLRGARAELAAPNRAKVRRTVFVPPTRPTLGQLRYQHAVMLADLRAACEAAWKPTAAADTHFVCADALDAELASWSDETMAGIGETVFAELAAFWHQVWNEQSELKALLVRAYRAGVSDSDDARYEYNYYYRHTDTARMPTPDELYAEWAGKNGVSESDWDIVGARYDAGWQYAIDRR